MISHCLRLLDLHRRAEGTQLTGQGEGARAPQLDLDAAVVARRPDPDARAEDHPQVADDLPHRAPVGPDRGATLIDLAGDQPPRLLEVEAVRAHDLLSGALH